MRSRPNNRKARRAPIQPDCYDNPSYPLDLVKYINSRRRRGGINVSTRKIMQVFRKQIGLWRREWEFASSRGDSC